MNSSNSFSSSTKPQPDQVDHQDLDFKKLLSTLPKHNSNSFDDHYEYQGFWYPLFMLPGVVSVQQQFQALPTDIFICGSPKTGNTWLKSLCFAIATRKQYHQNQTNDVDENINNSPLLKNVSHSLIPVLELEFPENQVNRNIYNLNIFATHIAYTTLPESITSLGCKIIYICREPKDTFVSYFHFIQKLKLSMTTGKSDFDLSHELDMFCQGKSSCGPYWDHVVGFYKASLESPDKFMLLKYEKLKMDAVFYVKKLAAFMDLPFSKDEELEGMPEKIVEMCSFESLKGFKSVNNYCTPRLEVEYKEFFRKGIAGDWKNELTVEMADRIDKITEEKLKGTGFSFA